MEHVLHRQQRQLAPWAQGMMLFGLVLCLVIPSTVDEAFARAICLPVAAVMLLAWLNFARLTVVVTREELRVGHPVFSSRIPLKHVREIEVIEHLGFWGWGGVGIRIRWGRNGGLGYITGSGPAIRLRVEGRRLPVVFSCNDPQAIVDSLKTAKCRAAGELP